jgi:hypothetical protein
VKVHSTSFSPDGMQVTIGMTGVGCNPDVYRIGCPPLGRRAPPATALRRGRHSPRRRGSRTDPGRARRRRDGAAAAGASPAARPPTGTTVPGRRRARCRARREACRQGRPGDATRPSTRPPESSRGARTTAA